MIFGFGKKRGPFPTVLDFYLSLPPVGDQLPVVMRNKSGKEVFTVECFRPMNCVECGAPISPDTYRGHVEIRPCAVSVRGATLCIMCDVLTFARTMILWSERFRNLRQINPASWPVTHHFKEIAHLRPHVLMSEPVNNEARQDQVWREIYTRVHSRIYGEG